jgi:hypothetical protein
VDEDSLDEWFEAHIGFGRSGEVSAGWIYVTTAAKEFKLTVHQLRAGIRSGLIQCGRVENPHNPSGPKSTVVERKQVKEHQAELQSLPRTAPPKQAQKPHAKPEIYRRQRTSTVVWEDKVTVPCHENQG